MADKLRLALCISGGGTTALEIIRACKSGRLKGIVPACVIASRLDAPGINKALAETIPTMVIDRVDHIIGVFKTQSIDLIGQYGWLPKMPADVVEAYAGRMINQHPGPLDPGYPDFGGRGMYGRRVHAARLFFVRATKRDFWTEATAQRVAKEYDCGEVLHRQIVPIYPDDDPISLQQRVLPAEHEVQIETLVMFTQNNAQGQVRSERLIRPGEACIFQDAKRSAGLLFPHG